MAPLTFSLLLTLSILSSALASFPAADDPLIRQVVSEGEEAVDQLLHADHHFTLFKSKYSKAYPTQEEHDYRFSVFKANLRRAKRNQLLDPSAVHGVTKFSDLTPEEFEKNYLGLHKQRLKLPADAQQAPKLPTSDLPADFDWREHGAVGAVKDQVLFMSFPRALLLVYLQSVGFGVTNCDFPPLSSVDLGFVLNFYVRCPVLSMNHTYKMFLFPFSLNHLQI